MPRISPTVVLYLSVQMVIPMTTLFGTLQRSLQHV